MQTLLRLQSKTTHLISPHHGVNGKRFADFYNVFSTPKPGSANKLSAFLRRRFGSLTIIVRRVVRRAEIEQQRVMLIAQHHQAMVDADAQSGKSTHSAYD